MSKIETYMAVDPGINGALCIMIGDNPVVYDTPTIIIEKGAGKKKKKVKIHDFAAVSDLLRPFYGQEVKFFLEKVSTRPGEGVVSSFNFGQSYALWKASSYCFRFQFHEATPTVWKKAYPELITQEIQDKKEELKAMKAQAKLLTSAIKKKAAKKEIASLNAKIKALGKDEARFLATKFYPDLEPLLKRKKDSDRAEAALMARYLKELE